MDYINQCQNIHVCECVVDCEAVFRILAIENSLYLAILPGSLYQKLIFGKL